MWLFLGDALLRWDPFLVPVLDDPRLPFVIGGCRDLDRFLDMLYWGIPPIYQDHLDVFVCVDRFLLRCRAIF